MTGPDEARGERGTLSRRRLLVLLAGALFLLTGGWLVQRFRDWRGERLWAWHRPGPPADAPPDRAVLETVVALSGTLHGRRLTPDDRRALRGRHAAAARRDSGWAREYRRAAGWLDAAARDRGSEGFVEAGDDVRRAVAARVMRLDVTSLRSELLALVSGRERGRRLVRRALVPHLSWVYRHSEPAWRRRGSPGWPAAPHGARAYTREVELDLC